MNEKGFSIIEIVIVLAVLVMILGLVASVFVYMSREHRNLLAGQQMNAEAGYIMNYVAQKVTDSPADSKGTCVPQTSGGSGVWEATHITSLSSPSGSYYEGIRFLDGNGICHDIYLDSDGTIKEDGVPITSQKFPLNYFIMVLDGDKTLSAVGEDDTAAYPRLTFTLDVAGQNGVPARLFQTTVSWRSPNGL